MMKRDFLNRGQKNIPALLGACLLAAGTYLPWIVWQGKVIAWGVNSDGWMYSALGFELLIVFLIGQKSSLLLLGLGFSQGALLCVMILSKMWVLVRSFNVLSFPDARIGLGLWAALFGAMLVMNASLLEVIRHSTATAWKTKEQGGS